MRDYKFGDKLYELRKKKNLTQEDLALLLDISDKAVSKWENGTSKPTIENLSKLSKIFDVSLDELIVLEEEKEKQKITKIVLTGGPCAGKTTAMNWIQNFFQKQGYKVLFVPETATELITGGLTPWETKTNSDFQSILFDLQLEKEKLFEEGAKKLPNEKVLIVCDRGLLDNKAYMPKRDFDYLLKTKKLSEVKLRDSYDAVFHLVTAAKGAKKYYNLDNAARTETVEEASKLDDNLIASWTGHPHLRIIDNSTDFEEKMKRLLKEISNVLGEPEPYEIERKYLIEYPDIKKLENMSNCQKIDIVQTYLKTYDESERRVRARGIDGNYLYYLTEKKKISNLKRVELEKKLSQDEYVKYLMEADNKLHTIRKTRYCLTENNQYFEIDIYPEWKNQAIMEIELSDEKENVNIPDFIKVIKEVTEDDNYKNYEMAKKMPKEYVKKKY